VEGEEKADEGACERTRSNEGEVAVEGGIYFLSNQLG